MLNKNIVIGLVLVVALAIVGWWFYSYSQTKPAPAENTQQTQMQNQKQENPVVDVKVDVKPVAKTYEVLYADAGFSPQNLTIKAGDTVTWKNQSSGQLWVGSAMHPTHTAYSGTTLQQHCPDTANTAFDECQAVQNGGSWSFTFTKTGSWGYHNHSNASKFGKITVE